MTECIPDYSVEFKIIHCVSFTIVQVLWNRVYQDLRANQQQDLQVVQGDTGGVGKSRDDIPYPMEWIMEWLVYKHTDTHTLKLSLQSVFIQFFFSEDVYVLCLRFSINNLFLNKLGSGLTLVIVESPVDPTKST